MNLAWGISSLSLAPSLDFLIFMEDLYTRCSHDICLPALVRKSHRIKDFEFPSVVGNDECTWKSVSGLLSYLSIVFFAFCRGMVHSEFSFHSLYHHTYCFFPHSIYLSNLWKKIDCLMASLGGLDMLLVLECAL